MQNFEFVKDKLLSSLQSCHQKDPPYCSNLLSEYRFFNFQKFQFKDIILPFASTFYFENIGWNNKKYTQFLSYHKHFHFFRYNVFSIFVLKTQILCKGKHKSGDDVLYNNTVRK